MIFAVSLPKKYMGLFYLHKKYKSTATFKSIRVLKHLETTNREPSSRETVNGTARIYHIGPMG